MASRGFVVLVALAAAFTAGGCTVSAQTPAPDADVCASPDPCGCVAITADQTCIPRGDSCICTSNPADSGPHDAGGPDVADAADALPPADIAAFVGKWSPVSGTGQANCGGQITALPPNPGAVLTFTQDGPNTLMAASSGAGNCTLELVVTGDTANLAQSSETCAVPTGGSVTFDTFTLLFTAAAGAGEGGTTSDAGEASDASLAADGASSNDDAGVDAAEPAADGSPSTEDASADGGAGPPARSSLDWQLGDTDGTCVTTLHYTLVRTE